MVQGQGEGAGRGLARSWNMSAVELAKDSPDTGATAVLGRCVCVCVCVCACVRVCVCVCVCVRACD